MGFQPQVAETVGGTVLIIERIESQNYVAGSSGWTIEADGTAEFNNVTVRGKLITGADGTQHIEINGSDAPQGIAFFTGDALETFPGVIQPQADATELSITMSSPLVAGHGGATFVLGTDKTDPNSDRLSLGAPVVEISASQNAYTYAGGTHIGQDVDGTGRYVDVNAPRIFLRDMTVSNTDGVAIVGQAAGGIVQTMTQAWVNVARVNSWVDFAGSRARYYKDAVGMVHVNGVVASGTAALIGTLPAGFRPSQSHEFVLPGAAAKNVVCDVSVDTTGAITVQSNLASAQARLGLDFAFPTF